MTTFNVTVRTNISKISYCALATTSSAAWSAAADAHGDTPCGITVMPASAGQ